MKHFQKLVVRNRDSKFAFENVQATIKEFDVAFKDLITKYVVASGVSLTTEEKQLNGKELFDLLLERGVELVNSARTTTLKVNSVEVLRFYQPQEKMNSKGLQITLEYKEL